MINKPSHVAIIMDGNGRWATARALARVRGHQQGVESVRAVIRSAMKHEIPVLTLFGFSTENWQRPPAEVDFLFSLFGRLLSTESKALVENGIRLQIIGDRTTLGDRLQATMLEAEERTRAGSKLCLNIAFNYGGRWDLVQAMRKLAHQVATGALQADAIDEQRIQQHLALSTLPEPDLFIRTSGEYRISNFLLWQCAYSELYFSPLFWPDFREAAFEEALEAYASRQRRFGDIPLACDQLPEAIHTPYRTQEQYA